jgi:diguanylate cyclase (GGDEF)-like protein/PAS domain S-box-containing protein
VPRIARSPFIFIGALLGFTLASLWGVTAWKSAQEKARAFAQAGSETQGLTHSLAQHASKTFGAVTLALLGAKQYVEHSDRSARASSEINDLLAAYVKSIPQVREIGVLSETGSWIFSSFETTPTGNNADREYFRYHRDNPDPTARVSEPLTSRVTGRPTVLVTQRLSGPGEAFAGVVLAAIDLSYFRTFYESFEVNQTRSVTLVKTNGTILAHRQEGESGKSLKQTSLFTNRLLESTTGLYPIVSPLDGRRKQFAYEVAPDFPVLVSVAVAEDDILKSWERDRRFDFGLAAGISVILLLLASVLAVQFRRSQATDIALRERERGYRLLAENVEDVVTRLTLDGQRLYTSPSIEKLLGFTPAEIATRSALANIHPAHQALVRSVLDGLGRGNRTGICEYLARRKDGRYIWCEAQFSYAIDEQGGAEELVAVIRDISKRKLAEEKLTTANEQLRSLSETDALTGIANRRKFDNVLEREMARGDRTSSEISVLMIDIDMFKGYNDTYGHGAGDECIRAVAQTLAANIRRPGDLLARYGGEEFAVILPETPASSAELVAETLRSAIEGLNMAHAANSHGVVTISIGATGGACGLGNASDLIQSADAMLYLAKKQGRNRACMATAGAVGHHAA